MIEQKIDPQPKFLDSCYKKNFELYLLLLKNSWVQVRLENCERRLK